MKIIRLLLNAIRDIPKLWLEFEKALQLFALMDAQCLIPSEMFIVSEYNYFLTEC